MSPRVRAGLVLAELAEAEEEFGPLGVTVRTFTDPNGSNKTALIAEIPDMEPFQEFMRSDAAADAMKHDGVRPETLLVLSEGQ